VAAAGGDESWVYESIVGAIPGVDIRPAVAMALQFVGFEALVLVLAWLYGLPTDAVVAGTVAVAVATAGSGAMLRIGRALRDPAVPAVYRRQVLATSVEVVLGLLAFVALVTYLFVVDPRQGGPDLLAGLVGADAPAPVVFLALLILWDLCYRIGTAWWASVAALWRSARLDVAPAAATELRRADLVTMAFGLVQLALVPFVLDHPLLLVAVVGHVAAVVVVTSSSVALLGLRART
jgi:hypothetical protein